MKRRRSNFYTVEEFLRKLKWLEENENVLYRILNDSNKSEFSQMLGYSRNGFANKIKNKSFSLKELVSIFTKIEAMTLEELETAKVDCSRFYTMNFKKLVHSYATNKETMRKMRKACRYPKQRSLSGLQGERASEEESSEKDT